LVRSTKQSANPTKLPTNKLIGFIRAVVGAVSIAAGAIVGAIARGAGALVVATCCWWSENVAFVALAVALVVAMFGAVVGADYGAFVASQ
jgi:hypothetical protein